MTRTAANALAVGLIALTVGLAMVSGALVGHLRDHREADRVTEAFRLAVVEYQIKSLEFGQRVIEFEKLKKERDTLWQQED